MAVWIKLDSELYIPNSKVNFIKIVEENGLTFLSIKMQVDSEAIPKRPEPLPADMEKDDQNKFRESRDSGLDILGENDVVLLLTKEDNNNPKSPCILTLRGIVDPKVPHTGG